MFAAFNGHLEVIQHLVKEGRADVNATNKTNGWTSLMYAAYNGHLEVVQYLVDSGGVEVNAKNNDKWTALMYAILNGHHEVVWYLANLKGECRASVNDKDNKGRTALMLAASIGHLEVVKCLVEECFADMTITNKDGWTALTFAAVNGHLEVVKFLVGEYPKSASDTDNSSRTVLMLAALNGQLAVVKHLIEEYKADVNVTDKNGWTAFKLVATNGHLKVVQYLVEKCDANMNATDNGKLTVLMGAAHLGQLEVVKYLVGKYPASVSDTDNNGWTALMYAAENGRIEVVRYLVKECDANMNPTRKDGKSAIAIAKDRGHEDIVRILVSLMNSQPPLTETFQKHSQPTIAETSSFELLPPYEIKLTKFVDTNAFGGEYLAKWLDADVTVKLFIPDAAHRSFKEEVHLWKQLRHPNVIKMYGACEAGPGLQFFVCEYADHRSLIEYVKATPEEIQTVWKYLYEAALGLEHLHDRDREIVHGDLRCSNILIGSDNVARLSNFRLCGGKSGKYLSVGSKRWQAPEILEGKESSPFASDVYSLGMCILEAITKKNPWNDKNNFAAEVHKIRWTPETEKYSSLDTPKCPNHDARDLVWHMCCKDPAKRMNLQDVVVELDRLALKERCFNEILQTVDNFKSGEIKREWENVKTRMKNCNNTQHHRAFDEFTPLYKHLHESAHHSTLLTRFHTLLTEFHTVITMTPEVLAMQLSSTRATTNTIYAFHRRIQSLWAALGQPIDGGVAQTDAQRREMFVSGLSSVDILLRELKSDEEKVAFLKTLKREMADQYTPTQQETMRKAVEVIENTIGKESLAPEWFIPRYQLIKYEDQFLGAGGFGSVFKAKWLDAEVAVKQVMPTGGAKGNSPSASRSSSNSSNESVEPQDLEEQAKKRAEVMKMFQREVEIWFGFSHPHVIQLFGACHVGSPFFVCEYATNGALDNYLREHPDELWQKLHEAALGVQYLHAREVVHGDLKGNNIVIGSDLKAKVTDFGFSSIVSDSGEAHISGASQWVAPECFADKPKLTFESDVYSLGMCIVEAMRVVTHDPHNVRGVEHSYPWGNVENATVKRHAKKGELPPRPSECTDAQWELVKRMCIFQPKKRIKISTVVDELARLASGKEDATAEPPSMESVRKAVSTARTVLTELDDTMYADLWDELEKVYDRIDGVQRSKAFCCLVKDAETATLKLRDTKTNLMFSFEKAMAVHALRRRLVKFVEAYPADEESRPIDADGASSARRPLTVDCD